MASSYTTLEPSDYKGFRRWYQQYMSTHGTPPPQHLTTSYLEASMESRIARAQEARALTLEEEKLGLAEEELEMQEEAIRASERAATISGITQLGTTGAIVYDVLRGTPQVPAPPATGAITPAVSTPSLATTISPSSTAPMSGAMAATPGELMGGTGEVLAPTAVESSATGMTATGALGSAGVGYAAGSLAGDYLFRGEPELGGALAGAAAGVAMGIPGGPPGMIIGGIIGGVTGFVGGGK